MNGFVDDLLMGDSSIFLFFCAQLLWRCLHAFKFVIPTIPSELLVRFLVLISSFLALAVLLTFFLRCFSFLYLIVHFIRCLPLAIMTNVRTKAERL